MIEQWRGNEAGTENEGAFGAWGNAIAPPCEHFHRSEFKDTTSRYAKNEVLFSVSCMDTRYAWGLFFPFFRVLSFLYVTITAHEVDHAHRRGIAPAPSQGRGFSSPYKFKLQVLITSPKENPQGTLKTRYFLAYLVCMRV